MAPLRSPRHSTLKAIGSTASETKDVGPATSGSWTNDETYGTLTDKAYRILEGMICTLTFPPGMVLSELSISNQLEIGRTPVREALQRLARDGLVVVMPKRGVLVSEIDVRAQIRLLEVRRVLEHLMARLSAERANKRERLEFAKIAHEMRDAGEKADDIAFMKLDRLLNQLIASTSRNEFASRSLGLTFALSRRFWYQHYLEAGDLPLAATLHANLAEAISNRDPELAGAASHELIDYLEAFTRKTLDV